MVVLPAASNPTINIRFSDLPHPLNNLANTLPMACFFCLKESSDAATAFFFF
jgi:hypothetical protein